MCTGETLGGYRGLKGTTIIQLNTHTLTQVVTSRYALSDANAGSTNWNDEYLVIT